MFIKTLPVVSQPTVILVSCYLFIYKCTTYLFFLHQCCSEKKIAAKFFEDVAEFYAYATPGQLLVKCGAIISRISYVSLIDF
jgi:hypothetical protein